MSNTALVCDVSSFLAIFYFGLTPNLSLQVVPIIDDLHDLLEEATNNTAYHPTVRHAAQRGRAALNKYYELTDESHIIRIGFCTYYYLLSLIVFVTNKFPPQVLHPDYKREYMESKEWPTEWVNEYVRLLLFHLHY